MKKLITAIAVIVALACTAAPYHSIHRGGPPHHYHHHSVWGRGGSHFWPGFTGGLVGSFLAPAVFHPTPPPPPVVLVNPVWVPPVYGVRPVHDGYGRVIRYEQYVVTPGYWR